VSNTSKHSDTGVDTQQITANFAKVGLDVAFVEAADLNEKEFRHKSTTSKAFYLTTPEGTVLESAAIARYIAAIGQGKLGGSTAFETAQVNQWIDFYNSTIEPLAQKVNKGSFGTGAID
jgi:glutathione S-transferase